MTQYERRRGDAIEIAGDYQYRALKEGFAVQRYWHASKTRIIEAKVPLSGSDIALDCGCGSGVVTDFLASKCREAVGVDGNANAVDFARKQFQRENLKFVCAQVDDLDYPAGHFTRIFCLEVFEHLYEPQVRGLLERFHQLLADGGILFVTTPNYRGLWPAVEWLADRSGKIAPMDESQHVSRYHAAKLRVALRESGFTIMDGGTFCTFAPFAAALSVGLADALFRFEAKCNLPFGNLLWMAARK